MLVIGPSTTFLHYIDQVLPSLGETGVVSRTIADLIPGIKATATDTPLAAKLKGDRRMAQVVANAIALHKAGKSGWTLRYGRDLSFRRRLLLWRLHRLTAKNYDTYLGKND